MRIQRQLSILPLFLLAPTLSASITLDCSHIRVDGTSWNLKALGGPHSVSHIVENALDTTNTTYTLDLCKPLKETECKTGTHVCGVERSIDKEGNEKLIGAISIAGNYVQETGRTMDPKVTRLKSIDSEREGLRIELRGGSVPFTKKGRKQQAVIEMICDPERSGLDDEKEETTEKRDERQSGDKEKDVDTSKSLRFKSYGAVDDIDVLRLDWLTKYACEDYKEEEGENTQHWGFFTWLIIIVFLGTSAYLIFGSWLNYNRYGARGWDLLPHGDTIRDIPYLMKDWGRRVVNTVQGPGARGGYSAV
ncbi:hypothetical protein AJ80_00128 [Polytolypa hystricis UAMH7299]|uniref:Autophagy-related protein 27 n=1 Tax=Polytolypa hystricis (strain UAMH7299) TaxID=1447883 RepID=A0A2B7Z5W5_POLH7|nr:hypothetical protein AJ80_00128 [Polytolypa hystricis UAMH7299]